MDALEAFRRLVDGTCGPPPLLQTAVQIARYADQGFEPERVLAEVAGWGERLKDRLPPDMSPLNRLRQVNHFFFGELGFHANDDAYYEAANSYLHRVIERRTGIPISLSLLYLEIGRAVGLRLSGVGFPGHFLVKLNLAEGAVLIDVYGGGIALSADVLRNRLRQAMGGTVAHPLEAYLRASTEREILARMLRNLKSIHQQASDWPAALEVQNRLVALLPSLADERLDRALLFERLECPRAAAADLVAYLSMRPGAPDAAELRGQLAAWQRSVRALN